VTWGELAVPRAEFERRLAAVRERLDADGFDGLLAFGSSETPGAVSYLTGFAPIFEITFCLVTHDSCDLVINPTEYATLDNVTWLEPDHVHRTREQIATVARLLRPLGRVAIAGWWSFPSPVHAILSDASDKLSLEPASVLDELRRIKSEVEIELIRAAAAAADAGTMTFAEGAVPGVTELELAQAIERSLRETGTSRLSFPVVLGSGVRSLDMTVLPGSKRIDAGEMVLLDCSARVAGYCADMARGLVVGEMTEQQERLLRTAILMYREALTLLRPGRDAREAHRRAVEVARDRGYEYVHETGHSIGTDIHEPPLIDEAPEPILLETNMVVAIEPGLYVEGIGGARFENTILITEEDPIELTRAPLELGSLA
jgi:Xaa-Pro aminopeptidase